MSELPELSGLDALTRAIDPITARFGEAGFRLYLVGGVVRDLVLAGSGPFDATANDIDLTTDAEPNDIKRLVAPVAEAMWTQGERFGTIGAKVGGHDLEITTHRAEAYDAESRKPVVSFGDDLDEDLSRRDFTVNAAAIELPSRQLHDPYGGIADLAAGVLRTPLSPAVSFGDDPLRMMRAARFMSRFGLAPTDDLIDAAAELADRLQIVSAERVADEIGRLLLVADPRPGLDFLDRTGLLIQILPELPADRLCESVRLAAGPGTARARLAGLLWPIGDGAADALRRLKYSRADIAGASKTISAVERGAVPGVTRPTVRRVVADVGIDRVADVRQLAVNLGDRPGCGELVRLLDELGASEDLTGLESPLSGGEIMSIIDVAPGPDVGKAQRFLRDLRLDNGPLSAADASTALAEWWTARSGH